MTIHYLKTWPEYFQSIKAGDKKADLRKNDRDFKVGDTLCFEEYSEGVYTNNRLSATVSHILRGPGFGLADGFVMMSLEFDEAEEPKGAVQEAWVEALSPEAINGMIAQEIGWRYREDIERWVEPSGIMAHVAPPAYATDLTTAELVIAHTTKKTGVFVATESFNGGTSATIITTHRFPRKHTKLYEAWADALPLSIARAYLVYRHATKKK